MRNLILLLAVFLISVKSFAQCSFTSTGAAPYTVTVEVIPTTLNTPASCPWGYGYTVNFDYIITFSGTPPSSDLNTLNGTLGCGANSHSFSLPLTNGTNSGTGETNNQWRAASDCGTATPTSIGCSSVSITIDGPNLTSQTGSCAAASSVPVEFLSFTTQTKPNGNLLEWSTASELNNDFFIVEYSQNGRVWQEEDIVSGNGTTQEVNTYHYMHYTRSNKTYYRLKQVNYDGSSEYSDVIISKNAKNSELAVWPNPTGDRMVIQLDETNFENVRIISFEGKDVSTLLTMISENSDQVTLDASRLTKGIYTVIFPTKAIKIIKL